MNDKTTELIGKLLDATAQRDAIHIAVAPVFASCDLLQGQDIGLIDGSADLVGPCEKPVGIVDPFLADPVTKGQRFFIFLYPGTITSLRHEWSHPGFVGNAAKSESQKWIEAFAARLDQTYNRLMEAAEDWIHGENYTYDNSERYKSHYDEFPEFWKHYEIVTGTQVKNKESFFTCSC